MKNSKLDYLTFWNSDLSGSSFKNADITLTLFVGANLTNVDFTNAQFSDLSDLTYCQDFADCTIIPLEREEFAVKLWGILTVLYND